MTKILWVSAGHFFETGYGLMSHDVVHYLQEQGFDVWAVSNQLDLGWSHGYVEVEGVKTIPKAQDPFLRDVIPYVIGRIRPDYIFSLWDIWIYYDPLNKINYFKYWKSMLEPQGIDFRWIPYTPVDADLFEECPIVKVAQESYHVIAMSKYGYKELSKFLPAHKITHIPHWVDTSLYYPKDFEEALWELDKYISTGNPNAPPLKNIINKDMFILLFVGENISERKDIPRLLRSYRLFLDMVKQQYPQYYDKVLLLLRTNPTPVPGNSFDINMIVNKLNLNKKVVIFAEKIPATYLNDIYNISTVYVSASRGEGFGIPIVEAMATGRPAILPNNSAHTEHVGENQERGWLVKSDNPAEVLWTASGQAYPVIDPVDMASKMFDAFRDWFENNGRVIHEKGKKALEYAQSLDKKKILPLFKILIEKLEAENSTESKDVQ